MMKNAKLLPKIAHEIKRLFQRTVFIKPRKRYYQRVYGITSHFNALIEVANICSLKRKNVLEIGGSNLPRELLFRDHKVASWTSIDYLEDWNNWHPGISNDKNPILQKHYAAEGILPLKDADKLIGKKDYLILNGSANDIPESFYGKFDTVVSFACLEHVDKLDVVLNKVYNCLKKNGLFYATAGCIGSSHIGHHFFVSRDMNFNTPMQNMIPPWAHLWMTEDDLRSHLKHCHSPELVEEIVLQCFNNRYINKLFYEDYERILKASPFENAEIIPTDSFLPNETLQKHLEKKYPGYSRFDVCHFKIIAKKA